MGSSDRLLLVRALAASPLSLSNPTEDLRGLEVLDGFGVRIGCVDELFIDERDGLVRLILVGLYEQAADAGGRLVPVEAVCRITKEQVTVTRGRAHVHAGPPDQRGVRDQRYLEAVYAHYGCYPFWEPGYVYPSYPVYPWDP